MANSVDPDQTAPIGAVCSGSTLIGAVCSGSTLFASLLKFASYVGQLFAAVDFSRRHFQMHFSWRFMSKFRFSIFLNPDHLMRVKSF